MDQTLRKTQVFWIAAGVVGGAAFYREFSDVVALNLALAICGFAMIGIGIYMLAMAHNEKMLTRKRSHELSLDEGSFNEMVLKTISIHQGFMPLDESFDNVLPNNPTQIIR